MIPHPVAIGMTICQAVIVEETTRRVSTINAFQRLELADLPGQAPTFVVSSVLTEGQGAGKLELVVTSLDSGDEIYSRSHTVNFSGVLIELLCVIELKDVVFPAAGLYQFTLLMDGDWIAHRRLRISQTKEKS